MKRYNVTLKVYGAYNATANDFDIITVNQVVPAYNLTMAINKTAIESGYFMYVAAWATEII